MAIVYWIRRPEHTDIFSEGYVGVTSRSLEERIADHVKVARKLGLKHKTLAAMWRWFDNGYNPSEKEGLLKTFKEESFGT